MPKLIISNVIKASELPPDIASKIKAALTFPNPVYESALKYNQYNRKIPKEIKAYKKKGKALHLERGYLPQLLELLKEHNLTPKVTWKTLKFPKTTLPKEINLWDYQKPWLSDLLKKHQGVGVAAPGSGKTICGLALYASLGQPCLWITHTKRLARQAMRRAEEFLGVKAGLIGAGKDDVQHFTVGIVSTLIRRDLKQYADKFGLIIIDECHHTPAKSFNVVVSAFPAHYRYGLTATPYRDDGLGPMMFHSMGPQTAYLSKDFLRSEGHLVTPVVIQRPTKFSFNYDPFRKDRNFAALQVAIPESEIRNRQIISDVIVEATSGNNICIVLIGRINHGEYLYDQLQAILPGVGFVHSKMATKQSDQVLDDFERGNLNVLVATYKMLAEGFDYPPSNRLFLTAPFKGRTLIEQACGRIERKSSQKTSSYVYDYVDVNVGVLEHQANLRKGIYELNNTPVITVE